MSATTDDPPNYYVLLEDGTRLDGLGCGAAGHAVGEVVFTTSMSGYQEAMTDPSYSHQLITFTFPQIGNYGVSELAMESHRIHAAGAIMRDAVDYTDAPSARQGWLSWLREHRIPAIEDVDTRALVRHLRERGAMRGGVFPASVSEAQARVLIDAEPPMRGRDLAAGVTPEAPVKVGDQAWAQAIEPHGEPVRIAMLDTGVKRSILAQLLARGAQVTLYPCRATAEQLLADDPDAVFMANGPGDPAALDHITATVRALLGVKPLYGICLGHQLLCRALGLETYKLAFGHHGTNHPVKDLATGRTEITSQNHGFAVLGPDGATTVPGDQPVRWRTDFGDAQLSHVNLYDRTVEGLRLLDVKAATVQYHPEAGPGPNDSLYIFDRFIEEIRASRA